MRFIPTLLHGLGDYILGMALLVVPLAWYEDNRTAALVPMVIGAVTILQSLMTRYELSLAKIIPMPMHLLMDAAAGAILAASPWLFGFYEDIWIPHVVLGVAEIIAAATTKLEPTSLHASDRGAVLDGSLAGRRH